jgi:hypothetical protein
MFLTSAELLEMTGYKRPSDQCRWLRDRGWSFELSAARKPVVLRAHAEHKLGKVRYSVEPNFGALRKSA